MLIACGAGILVGALVGGLAYLRNLLLPVFSSTVRGARSSSSIRSSPPGSASARSRRSSSPASYGFFPVMLSTAAGIRTIEPQLPAGGARPWARPCRSRSGAS
ncbi:MAG: hypothetical protein WDO24_09645 [Pseudomonadota bacterium]